MQKIIKKYFITINCFTCISILLLLLILSSQNNAHARQFRLIKPIATADQSDSSLPAGAESVEQIQGFKRSEIEPLVRDVISKWNTSDMSSILSDEFYDKSRLLDVMDTGVPRDATITIQSVQGIQTLGQYIVPGSGGERGEIVSTVSATVRTQIEYNNSSGNLVKTNGVNELLLEVRTAAPPEL